MHRGHGANRPHDPPFCCAPGVLFTGPPSYLNLISREESFGDQHSKGLDREAATRSPSRGRIFSPDVQIGSRNPPRRASRRIFGSTRRLHGNLFSARRPELLGIPPFAVGRALALLRRSAAVGARNRFRRKLLSNSLGRRSGSRSSFASSGPGRELVRLSRGRLEFVCAGWLHRRARIRFSGLRDGKSKRTSSPLSAASGFDRALDESLTHWAVRLWFSVPSVVKRVWVSSSQPRPF